MKRHFDQLFRSVILFFAFGAMTTAALGQDQGRLSALKQKYPWGSIYLTYTSLINLSSIVNDGNRVQVIQRDFGNSAVGNLRGFLARFMGSKISEGVAFVQIDLNRVEAGYKRANDPGGEINRIAWSNDDVVRIADLCDRQINTLGSAANIISMIKRGSVTITGLFDVVTQLVRDPYASAELVFVISKEFRIQVSLKGYLKEESPNKNSTKMSVERFSNEFDEIFFTNSMNEFMLSVNPYAANWKEPRLIDEEFMRRAAALEASLKSTPDK